MIRRSEYEMLAPSAEPPALDCKRGCGVHKLTQAGSEQEG